MGEQQGDVSLSARWVFPVCGPPIADGRVTIRGEHIVAVGPAAKDAPIHPVAIVPGFVNAHTHLEFSDLAAPLGTPGMSMSQWVSLVMAQRRTASAPAWANVRRGLRESLSAGTTALGEIATSDWREAAAASGETLPEVVMFRESIGPTADRVAGAATVAEQFLAATVSESHIRPALSPHAPYTVRPELLLALVELGCRHDVPLAMHLAESRDEIELLASGGGPMRTLLESVGAWDPAPVARYTRVLDYLAALARAPRALVIHGNYLSDEELEFLAARAATMSVVYCPRTHAFFGHPPYPLARMLQRGVRVALGTDSRASNPDLSMLGEMCSVAKRHPDVPADAILELATRSGARALGLDAEMGTLEPGKLANLAIVRLGAGDGPDSHAALLHPESRAVQTYVRGQPKDVAVGKPPSEAGG